MRGLSPAGTEVFDRTLDEICLHIVEIAARLPGFELETTRELLRREDMIVERVNRILNWLPPRAWDAQMFETRYRDHIVWKLDHLQLFGLELSQRYPLSVAYITLTATAPVGMSQGRAAPSYLRVEKVLAQSRRLLIRGQAGSGKTTLLQWLAVRSARREFPAALADWNETVPFLLQLRYFSDRLPSPEEFLREVAPNIAGVMPPEWAHEQLRMGRALVLIDGIDELPRSARGLAHDWLMDLVASFPNARYVVTSRQAAVAQGWLHAGGFAESELQPMSRPDINAFITHWHTAMTETGSSGEDKRELLRLSVRLQTLVNENRYLRRLATSPLLCAMICALHRDRREDLPRRRMALYSEALDMLVERRDVVRRIPRGNKSLPTLEQTYLLLQDLAWWLVVNGRNEANSDEVIARLENKLATMSQVGATAGEVYEHLLVRSGTLREPAKDRVDFVHRTFQEYLAAREAVRNNDIGVLVRNAHLDQWHEVVVLAAGRASQTNERQLEQLFAGLLERGQRQAKYRYRLYLLAVACLETCEVQPAPPQLEELRDCMQALVPPKRMADAADLASAGELAIQPLEQRARLRQDGARTTAACIRTLALVGSEAALAALEQFAADSRVSVVRELVRAWGYFEPMRFAAIVMAHSPLEHGDLELRDPTLLQAANSLPQLDRLHGQFTGRVSDLDFVEGIRKLATLDLSFSGVKDLRPLGRLATPDTLHWLSLAGCEQVADIRPLAALPRLRVLHLSNCQGWSTSPRWRR